MTDAERLKKALDEQTFCGDMAQMAVLLRAECLRLREENNFLHEGKALLEKELCKRDASWLAAQRRRHVEMLRAEAKKGGDTRRVYAFDDAARMIEEEK